MTGWCGSASAMTASAGPIRPGTGLVGLKDRVEATGGTLRVQSRPGQGTALLVELPMDPDQPPTQADRWRAATCPLSSLTMGLVAVTGHRRIPPNSEHEMDAGVDDMPTHRRETRSVKDLTAYWKEASRMSKPARSTARPPSGAAASAHHPTGP